MLSSFRRPYATRAIRVRDLVSSRDRQPTYEAMMVACHGCLDRPERQPTGGTSKQSGILTPEYLVHTVIGD